jgi:PAS domain S-box-containing protein
MDRYFVGSPIAMAVVSKSSGLIYAVNNAFSALMGVAGQSLQGRPMAELFQRADLQNGPGSAWYNPAFGEVDGTPVPVKLIQPNAKLLEGTLTYTDVRGGDSDFARVAFLDNLQAGQDQLLEDTTRRHNQTLIDSLPDMVFVLDATGVFVDCSSGHREQMLIPPEQVLGANIRDVLPPEMADELMGKIAAVLRGETTAPLEYSLPMGSNLEHFEARLSSLRQRHVLVVARNVTESHQVRAELLLQTRLQELLMDLSATYIHLPPEQLDAAIADSLRDLSLFVDADRAYIFSYHWDENYCRNTHEWCKDGIDPQIDELQYTPLDMIPEAVSYHSRGETLYLPDVASLPQGSLRDILEMQGIQSLILVPMMGADRTVGFVGFDSVRHKHSYSQTEQRLLTVFARMLVQVQDRKAADERLREATRHAERLAEIASRANDAKSEFLAHMSHEIRTPMHGILGTIELLAGTALLPEQKSYVQTLGKSANGLLALLNDVLDFSKIEAGQLALEHGPMDVHDLLSDVVRLFEPMVSDRAVELRLTTSPEVPYRLLGDAVRLRQMVSNLVSNAVKFTDEGLVHVQWSGTQQTDGVWWFQLVVEDTGVGILDSQLSRLFVPFSQADSSNARRFGGTGLGLTLVHKLTEAMGGTVSLESQANQGTRVTVSLPLQVDPEDAQTSVAAADIGPPGLPELPAGARILIVEDQEVNRTIAVRMLEQAGAKTAVALDGAEAVAMAAAATFDLIFMDCQLPLLDGLEATRAIRRREAEEGRHTPIVAVTAHATSTDRQRCLDAGMDDYLTKPTPRHALLRMAKLWLRPDLSPVAPAEVNIDSARWEELLDAFDEQELWEKIVVPFIEQGRATLAELHRATEPPANRDALRRIGHALAGSASAIGLVDVTDSAKALEVASRRGDDQTLEEACGQLKSVLRLALEGLPARRPVAPNQMYPNETALSE